MTSQRLDILRSSHILLPGVGALTEKRLWQRGVPTLEDFMASPRIPGIGPERKRALDRDAARALSALAGGEAAFLASRLPHREAWRLFTRFERDAAFVDIETDGLSRLSAVTVVGVFRPGAGYQGLVREEGLSAAAISQALDGARLIVTFNGASFDLPFIRAAFPFARLPRAHLDLLSVARRIGWTGGLKGIERRLGVARDLETRVLAGFDAVRLWRTYKRTGSTNARRLLVAYNRADCENLVPVARALVAEVAARTGAPSAAGSRQASLPDA